MRPVVMAVVGTIAGLYGLLQYKSGPPPGRLTTAASAPSTSTPTSTSTSTTTPAHRRRVAPPVTTTTVPGPRTIDGATAHNRYGDVQVRLVVQRGRITDVEALQLPRDRTRSAYISQVAGPRLRIEVLNAQSAAIDIVSGATYTSQSYAQSVQSALDRLPR